MKNEKDAIDLLEDLIRARVAEDLKRAQVEVESIARLGSKPGDLIRKVLADAGVETQSVLLSSKAFYRCLALWMDIGREMNKSAGTPACLKEEDASHAAEVAISQAVPTREFPVDESQAACKALGIAKERVAAIVLEEFGWQ